MIFSMAATIPCISASAPAACSLRCLRRGLIFATFAGQRRALLCHLRHETYEILTSGRPIRNRMLTPLSAKDPPARRRSMLDIAFVVLGIAVLALMGAYALALREL